MTKLRTNKCMKTIKGIRKYYHLLNYNKCYKNLKIISLTYNDNIELTNTLSYTIIVKNTIR